MQRAIPALEQEGAGGAGPREGGGREPIVVAADVHDDLGNQAREVSAVLAGMAARGAGLGLTFYQAVDDEPEAPRAGLRACCAPSGPEATEHAGLGGGGGGDPPGDGAKRPRRAAVANRRRLQGVQWCVDAGLLMSTAEWRAGLAELIRSSCRRRARTGGSPGDSPGDGSVGSGDGGGDGSGDGGGDGGGGTGGCLGAYSYAGGFGEHACAYHSLVGLASSHSDELALHEFLLEGRCRSLQRLASRPSPLPTPPLPTPPSPRRPAHDALPRRPPPTIALHRPPLPASPASVASLPAPATWRTLNMRGGVKGPLKLATSSRPWQICAASASAAAAPGPGAATPLPALLRGIQAEAAGSCGEAALATARKGRARRRWPGRRGALLGSGWRSAIWRSGRAGP